MKKIYGFLVVLLFAFGCSQNNVFSLKVGHVLLIPFLEKK